MASHTPFTDPASFDLRQHLTDTTIGPAEMYALALVYYPDPDAVDALCEHAAGSFRLLVALFAAAQEPAAAHRVTASKHDRDWFREQVVAYVVDQLRNATDVDLLEGLRTARTVSTGSSLRPYRTGPLYVSELFAEHALDVSLTDRVVAEMSLRFPDLLFPELGMETRRASPQRRNTRPAVEVEGFVSRFLLSKFGMHAPSWDMFRHVHTPDATIAEIADMVAEIEQNTSAPSLTAVVAQLQLARAAV